MQRIEVLRLLRLPCHLAYATAEWIVSDAQDAGNRAFEEEREPTGDDLHSRIARAQYQARERQAREEWERDITPDPETAAATALAFAALRAGQTQASAKEDVDTIRDQEESLLPTVPYTAPLPDEHPQNMLGTP